MYKFARISFAAPIVRKGGKAVYDGDTESYREIGRAAKVIWRNTPSLQNTIMQDFAVETMALNSAR